MKHKPLEIDDPILPERFWSKVVPEPNSGCWLWTGSTNGRGYGELRFHQGPRGKQYAHRLVLFGYEKETPTNVVDHLCRTPSCCNPAHLEVVTHRENVRRGTSQCGLFCRRGHAADWYVKPSGNQRHCKICAKEAARAKIKL